MNANAELDALRQEVARMNQRLADLTGRETKYLGRLDPLNRNRPLRLGRGDRFQTPDGKIAYIERARKQIDENGCIRCITVDLDTGKVVYSYILCATLLESVYFGQDVAGLENIRQILREQRFQSENGSK